MNKILNQITTLKVLSFLVFLIINNYAFNQDSPCECGELGP